MADELNRRTFLKTAALAAGPALVSARAANDKVNIGWIGVGTRGYAGLDWLHTAAPNDVQITAICDTYQGYIARAKDRMQTIWGTTPKTFVASCGRNSSANSMSGRTNSSWCSNCW